MVHNSIGYSSHVIVSTIIPVYSLHTNSEINIINMIRKEFFNKHILYNKLIMYALINVYCVLFAHFFDKNAVSVSLHKLKTKTHNEVILLL